MILPRDGLERENPQDHAAVHGVAEGNVPASAALPPSFCHDVARPEERFSGYSILATIGSGLRGTVHRARNDRGRLFALKVFNRGVGVDAAVLRRFSPAAEDRIAHPSLVEI